jgi:alkylation response protein AidB-like acyl-CoA dehydrogenase
MLSLLTDSLDTARSIEDATNHANRRVVFGKKLIEQPVVRHQLAHMAREVEALQACALRCKLLSAPGLQLTPSAL